MLIQEKFATPEYPTHLSEDGKFAIIHNGIIENYAELKLMLLDRGHVFISDTDTEVMVHLIEEYYQGDFVHAVRQALKAVTGAYAFVASHADHEEK